MTAHGARPPLPAGGVTVRRAGPEDWAALRQARLAALADSPAAFASTLAHERDLGEAEWRQRTRSAIWLLAWQEGVPAGLVAGVVPADGGDGTGWHLMSMWAGPRVRGRGVADLLVDALAAAVKDRGGRRLTLWAADGNDRARAFYRRKGFRPTGRRQACQRRDGSVFDEDEFALAW